MTTPLTLETYLLDVANALVKRGLRGDRQLFVDEALTYVDALGVTCDRASVTTTLDGSHRLRRHGYFCAANDERVSAAAAADAEHVDIEAAAAAAAATTPTAALGPTLSRLVTQLRERILSETFLNESNGARTDEFFVHLDLIYSRELHEPLMERLRETYTAAAAEHKPLRPIFMSPFIKNVEQCRADRERDVCATLFFRFAGDPRSAIVARRSQLAAAGK